MAEEKSFKTLLECYEKLQCLLFGNKDDHDVQDGNSRSRRSPRVKSRSSMSTYMLMMCVTLEQEEAIQKIYQQNGWQYQGEGYISKKELTTMVLGENRQSPPRRQPQSASVHLFHTSQTKQNRTKHLAPLRKKSPLNRKTTVCSDSSENVPMGNIVTFDLQGSNSCDKDIGSTDTEDQTPEDGFSSVLNDNISSLIKHRVQPKDFKRTATDEVSPKIVKARKIETATSETAGSSSVLPELDSLNSSLERVSSGMDIVQPPNLQSVVPNESVFEDFVITEIKVKEEPSDGDEEDQFDAGEDDGGDEEEPGPSGVQEEQDNSNFVVKNEPSQGPSSGDNIGGTSQELANYTVKVEIQPSEPQTEKILVFDQEETGPTMFLIRKESDQPRFRHLDDNELNELAKSRYSESTKRNTQWGIQLFQDWCCETYGEPSSLSTIPVDELKQKLRRFYAEAAPRRTESRKKRFGSDEYYSDYHRNTLKNVQGAINRHFKNIGRDIDIVKDRTFAQANDMLRARLKHSLKTGKSRPTEQQTIPRNDLAAIKLYLKTDNPMCLRYRVWYILTTQFVSGYDFLKQLKLDSFKFVTDSNGEYAQLKHEVREKQFSTPKNEKVGKKIYATGEEDCPVKHLKLLISKCNPNAPALFCSVNKGYEGADPENAYWYTCTPVTKRQFSSYMTDLCRKVGVPRYTAQNLRATATQAHSEAGVELRDAMFMTGHQTEAAMGSCSRGVQTAVEECKQHGHENV